MKINHKIQTLFAIILTGILVSFMQGCSSSYYVVHQYKPVTVSDIIQMSKDKVPPSTIIQKIKKSHTLYKLSASQLADLEKQGVSPEVINYMEQTHLNAVRHNQQLEDSYYWWPGWDGYYYGGPAFGWPDDYWDWNWGGDFDSGDEGDFENH